MKYVDDYVGNYTSNVLESLIKINEEGLTLEQVSQSSRKNLLIGSITNYSWEDVAPFFNSYVQAGFENCHCVMFTANISEDTLSKIHSCGVETIPIPEEYLSGQIVIYRFKLYHEFMLKVKGKYDMVLTADVRDVIFQRDLFGLCDSSRPFLGIALEDGTLSETSDTKWIVDSYGQELHSTIMNERIICMGTVWGTASEFTAFVGELVKEMEAVPNPNDQGSANVILYSKKMFAEILRPSTNYDGLVITVNHDLALTPEGDMLNGAGEIAAVVHKYDRFPKLVNVVQHKFLGRR